MEGIGLCVFCGRPAAVMHTCMFCGAMCCSDCFDMAKGMCKGCSKGRMMK